MLHGKDIILLSSIEWDFLWQHPQEIAVRLAEAGNRVLYVENTGVRSPGLKDAKRVANRLKLWSGSVFRRGVREVRPNLYVTYPLVLPPFGPLWRRQINRRLLLPVVRRAARKLGMRDPIVWTHLPTDTALELIRLLRSPKSTVLYYCIADFAQLTPHKAQLQSAEKQIVEQSDLVFANSGHLAAHCKQWRDDVHVFPPGVNLDAFAANEKDANEQGQPEVEQGWQAYEHLLRSRMSSEPIIGYVGALNRHVNYKLLLAMARARPLWHWVFVGPLQTDVRDLSRLSNVMLLGQQPHRSLVNYIRFFDVCIVAYLDNAETVTMVPVKINEFLAAGKPVVSTGLPAVNEFNEQHGVLRIAAAKPESFLYAIEQALTETNGEAVIAKRRRVATLGDWSRRLEAMSQLVEAEESRRQGEAS